MRHLTVVFALLAYMASKMWLFPGSTTLPLISAVIMVVFVLILIPAGG